MIQAKIVADSITEQGYRLTTMEVVMPRYILAEFNTHRMLSKNSASSRAIPFSKMVKNVQDSPFVPYAWQKDHKGMQGNEYFTDNVDIKANIFNWLEARDRAVATASWMHEGKVTKQLVNRLLEPFMYHKVLVSGTEWENFFNLRCPRYTWEYEDGTIVAKSKEEFIKMFIARYPTNGEAELHEMELVDEHLNPNDSIEWYKINEGQADIHMMVLAEAIYDAMNESIPMKLKEGEYHIPYSDNMDVSVCLRLAIANSIVEIKEFISDYTKEEIDLVWKEFATKIAIARCARLSYQTLGDNPVIDYEKDLALYESLSTSGHWSPFEHVAKAMTDHEYNTYFKGIADYESIEGYNLTDDKGLGWCRNYRGFIQYRELLD